MKQNRLSGYILLESIIALGVMMLTVYLFWDNMNNRKIITERLLETLAITRLEQNIFVLDQSVDLRTVIDIASYQPLIAKELSKFSVTLVNSNGDDIVIINE